MGQSTSSTLRSLKPFGKKKRTPTPPTNPPAKGTAPPSKAAYVLQTAKVKWGEGWLTSLENLLDEWTQVSNEQEDTAINTQSDDVYNAIQKLRVSDERTKLNTGITAFGDFTQSVLDGLKAPLLYPDSVKLALTKAREPAFLVEAINDRLRASSVTYSALQSVSTLRQVDRDVRSQGVDVKSPRELYVLTERESDEAVGVGSISPTSLLDGLAISPKLIIDGKKDIDIILLGLLFRARGSSKDGLKAYPINVAIMSRYLELGAKAEVPGTDTVSAVEWDAAAVKAFLEQHKAVIDAIVPATPDTKAT